MHLRFLFLIGACALLSAGASVAGQAQPRLALELRSSARIVHPRIVLGDVAVIDTRNPDSVRLAAIEIGNAPRVGYVERLTRAQIMHTLRRQVDSETIAWSGASSITVSVQSQ